ncbi:MAG TPA: hypothetical protein VM841_11150 [Actinomycetota bacterium]|nr:hypothetical protein [Actinomycetota bacterium]
MLGPENGIIKAALEGWKDEVGKNLEDVFDADSKSSAIAKIDEVVRTGVEKQLGDLRKMLHDPTDGPLGRMYGAITKAVKDQGETLGKEIAELAEALKIQAAKAEVEKATSRKGFAYEDLLHAAVTNVVAANGDVAEKVAKTKGLAGTEKGDEIVTVNTDDTLGTVVAYVIEAKDNGSYSVRTALKECETAMKNRGTKVGIIAFANAGQIAIDGDFHVFGDKAIIVYDREDPDPRVLKIACAWGRAEARRKMAGTGPTIDLSRIESLVADARRALGRGKTIKSCLTVGKKQMDSAGAELTALLDEVDTVLDDVCNELNKSGEKDAA